MAPPRITAQQARGILKLLRDRQAVASPLSAKEWAEIPVEIRQQAFWSAKLEHARHVEELKKVCLEALRGTFRKVGTLRTFAGKDKEARVLMSRGQVIKEMMAAAKERGLMPTGPRAIENPASYARIKLIEDMSRRMTLGRARFESDNDAVAVKYWPAQELYRAEVRVEPRNWPERWTERGDGIGWEGALPIEKAGGRMIALKSSPIWTEISAFGLPHPPFDYNSGMGVRGVSVLETRRLGLLSSGEQARPADKKPVEIRNDIKTMDPAMREWFLKEMRDRLGDDRVFVEGDEVVYRQG